jgi:hypothetical protein
VNLILPLIAFVVGWILAQTRFAVGLKPAFATLLARVFIPIVIIYNMVFYQTGSLSLMLFSFVSAVLLYALFMQCFKDRLGALCFSYVNMAWLGFPFAIALFGPELALLWLPYILAGLFLAIFGQSLRCLRSRKKNRSL